MNGLLHECSNECVTDRPVSRGEHLTMIVKRPALDTGCLTTIVEVNRVEEGALTMVVKIPVSRGRDFDNHCQTPRV